MMLRLLIDECLSPELVDDAIAAGHVEATCVRDRGLLQTKDWDLMVWVVAGDFTLVTHNARDFRGAGASQPGGYHAVQPIHAGLICLNSLFPMDLDRQHGLFKIALDHLATLPDLVNQALEIFEDENSMVTVTLYEIPSAN